MDQIKATRNTQHVTTNTQHAIRNTQYAILDRIILILLGIYVFIYVFSVPMLMLDWVPPWGTWMGGFLNLLQGSLMGLWLFANARWRGLVAALLIVVLAFAVEYVGVTTGVPFGRYSYTDMLGWKLFGAVALPIPFAWLLIVPAAIGMCRLIGVRGAWVVLVAPLLVTAYDLLLEPFAAYIMDYWRWIDTGPYYGVPTANFFAWFGTALVLTIVTLGLCGSRLTRATVLPWVPALLYALNLLLVTLVDLAYGYGLAALIGAVVLAICGWRWWTGGHGDLETCRHGDTEIW